MSATTWMVLDELAARQEELGRRLAATGLASFTDRSEWLIAHRSADERLAWQRHWAALGITDPEPRKPVKNRTNEAPKVQPTSPCARCGVLRVVRDNRGCLCADCRSVLSREEVALWVA